MKRDSVPAIAPPVDPEWAAEIGLDLSDPGIRRLCDRPEKRFRKLPANLDLSDASFAGAKVSNPNAFLFGRLADLQRCNAPTEATPNHGRSHGIESMWIAPFILNLWTVARKDAGASGSEIAELQSEFLRDSVCIACKFHDIGKNRAWLEKVARHEYEEEISAEKKSDYSLHSGSGARSLVDVGRELLEIFPGDRRAQVLAACVKHAAEIVLYHHERFDGNGPFGLKGDEIPIESQIIALAENYSGRINAKWIMAGGKHVRTRGPMTHEEAIRSMAADSGRFNPELLRLFLRSPYSRDPLLYRGVQTDYFEKAPHRSLSIREKATRTAELFDNNRLLMHRVESASHLTTGMIDGLPQINLDYSSALDIAGAIRRKGFCSLPSTLPIKGVPISIPGGSSLIEPWDSFLLILDPDRLDITRISRVDTSILRQLRETGTTPATVEDIGDLADKSRELAGTSLQYEVLVTLKNEEPFLGIAAQVPPLHEFFTEKAFAWLARRAFARIGIDLPLFLYDRTKGELTRWEPDRGEVVEIAGYLPLEPVRAALLRAIEEDPLFNH